MAPNFRPPAVPLVTVDPYFSVWSAADRLYDDHTRHWTNKRHSMAGIVWIDGQARAFMGKVGLDENDTSSEPAPLEQTRREVLPLSSRYAFEGEGVSLEVDFTTPLLMDRLEVLSRPASYVTFNVRSTDGKPHHVKLYFDVSAELCVNTPDQKVVWSRRSVRRDIEAMRIGTEEQPVLQRAGDDVRIDWGYLYLVSPPSATVQTQTCIHGYGVRKRFIETGDVPPSDDERMPRAADDDTPVLAAVVDFGRVGDAEKSHYFVLAYDDVKSIEYFGTPLEAYWRRSGMSTDDMLAAAVEQYGRLMEACGAFNRQLAAESAAAGGEKYKDMLSLAYRQAIAAHKLVADENGEILFLSKECFSNGCIGTVDVSYPSIPLFLRYNPELVKGMMRPIFRYANTERWPYDFAPHDVGCYPKANGQVYGENKLEYQMPIEECGNMLIMAAAVSLFGNDAQFAERHWELLSKWANYLAEYGLDPQNQLCTDDFAGHLAHNANLSVKAIIGLGAYSVMCGMLGKAEEKAEYFQMAGRMAKQWEDMAAAGDHYKLTFDGSAETWSMKYNLVWDRLFGLHLFSGSIIENELAHYIARRNRYGTPLDNRNTYTKADWLVWCASFAKTPEQFEQMIAPLWDFLNESPSRVAFSDWYDTVTGKQVGFQNRTVVGGVFIKLLQPVAAKE